MVYINNTNCVTLSWKIITSSWNNKFTDTVCIIINLYNLKWSINWSLLDSAKNYSENIQLWIEVLFNVEYIDR